jgi:hypothetical protein
MLARLAKHEERSEGYRGWLEDWASMLGDRSAAHARWSLDEFWDLLSSRGGRISVSTRMFVGSWVNLARDSAAARSIADNDRAHRLVKEREVALKHGRARLVNPRSLELWSGASGSAQLGYRWTGSQIIINDILNGLSSEANDA